MSIMELYDQAVRPLPTAEQLQLAALILNRIAPPEGIDESTEWSEEDLRGVTAYSLRHAAESYPEVEEIA